MGLLSVDSPACTLKLNVLAVGHRDENRGDEKSDMGNTFYSLFLKATRVTLAPAEIIFTGRGTCTAERSFASTVTTVKEIAVIMFTAFDRVLSPAVMIPAVYTYLHW